jgi:beta-lactamase regulating signal transducer with metallopeptidase domain
MSVLALLRDVSAATVSQLAWASISAAVIVALAWAIARLRPSLAPATRSALWWAVSVAILLRLAPLPALTVEIAETSILARLVPAAPAPAARLQPIQAPLPATAATPSSAARPTRPAPAAADRISAIAAASHPIERPLITAAGPRPIDWPIAVVVAWAGIAAWLLVRLAIETWRIRRVVADATPAPAFIADEAGRLAAAFDLRAAPPVRISTAIDTPQVAGFWHPTLLLPESLAQTMTPRERAMTLCHELAHVRRLDLALAWAPALAERLLFFHPGARLAAREYALAREAACDAEVLQRLGAAPRDYGRLLLRLGVTGRPATMVAAQSSPSMRLLRRRLAMLNDQKPHGRAPRGAWLAGVALVALAMPLSLVARQSDPPPLPPAPPVPAIAAVPPPSPVAAIAALPPAPPSPAIAALPPVHAAPPPPMPAVAVTAHPSELPLPPAPPAVAVPPIAAVPPAPRAVDDDQAPPPPPPPPPAPRGKPVPPPPPPPPPPADSFILMGADGVQHVAGSRRDIEDARRLRGSADGPFLYFRSGEDVYTSRDQSLIERVRAEMQEQMALGARQAELGRHQAELGSEQATLGAKQGTLGHKQAEFGAAMAAHAQEHGQLAALEAALAALKQDTKPPTQEIEAARKAVEQAIESLRLSGKTTGLEAERAAQKIHAAAQRDIAEKQREMGQLQSELGRKQATLGAQQAELGKLQRQAAERARARIKPMLEEAVRSGTAQPVK